MMLTNNLDIQDRLTNGQTGNISHNVWSAQCCVRKVYIKFPNEQNGLKAMKSSYQGRQSS